MGNCETAVNPCGRLSPQGEILSESKEPKSWRKRVGVEPTKAGFYAPALLKFIVIITDTDSKTGFPVVFKPPSEGHLGL
jgi:hypothetical protein